MYDKLAIAQITSSYVFYYIEQHKSIIVWWSHCEKLNNILIQGYLCKTSVVFTFLSFNNLIATYGVVD